MNKYIHLVLSDYTDYCTYAYFKHPWKCYYYSLLDLYKRYSQCRQRLHSLLKSLKNFLWLRSGYTLNVTTAGEAA